MSNCQNGAPPMFLAWTNISVTTNETINRGIEVAVGSPPQPLSLRPSFDDLDLYVVNIQNCAPEYNDTCAGSFGGLYNPAISSTFRKTSEAQWNGTHVPGVDSPASVYFNDVLYFGANGTAYDYPLYLDQPGYGGQGTLPLGWTSTFLKAAVEIGAAPSRAFGLWTGSRSIDFPVDGSLVLGGYDSTRFGGLSELTTFPAFEGCTTCPTVTGLTYDTADSSINIFANASETLQISLQPGVRVLYVTNDMFARFANASNGVYDPSLGELTYPASNPPTGNLSVTLSNGYQTVIPTEELFVYPRLYENGTYSISNNTILIAEILNKTNDGFVANWGIPYLTMNYFIGDWARNQYMMAPAIRTDFSAQGGGYQLEAYCDPVVTSSATKSATPTTPTSPVTSSPVPSPSSSKSSNTGALVGGVVGGVLGFILIVGGLALLFYRSRRRRNRNAALPVAANEMSRPGDGRSERYSQYTGTTPHDTNDVASEGKGPHSVANWVSSQDPNSPYEAPLSPRLDFPHEMPAHGYDVK